MKNNQPENNSRRNFIQTGITLGTMLPLLGKPFLSSAMPLKNSKVEKALHPLKILILGGTSFLGP